MPPGRTVAFDRDKTLQAAAKLVDKKKYDKAILEYQKVVQSDPTDARTMLRIGDLQSRMLDYKGAVGTYDQVARYYSAQGFHLKAIAVFKQIRELIKKHAPELGPRYGHVLPKLAEIYAELGLISDALVAYDEVAANYQSLGRDREAVDVLRKAVELDPQNPLPHLRLAEASCRISDLDTAITAFWTAAGILLDLKRPDDALRVLERILTFRPDPEYARAAAELYLRYNTNEAGMAALARLQVAFQANPKDLDTLSLLAQAFDMIGQPEKAFAVHLEMARLARDQGRPQLFAEILAHLKRLAPLHDQVIALDRLGPVATSMIPPAASNRSVPPGRRPPPPPGARPSSLAPSIELTEDDSPQVEFEEDVEWLDEGEEEVDVEAYEPAPGPRPASESFGSNPESVGAHSFQPSSSTRKAIVNAEAFERLGLLDKAVESLHLALETDPNSVPIREKLREILVGAGEREAAIEETLNIAIIHLHNQDTVAAEPLIVEVLEIEPEHPEAARLLEHLEALRAGAVPAADDGSLGSYDLEGVPPTSAIKLPEGNAPLPKFGGDSTPPQRPRPSLEAIEEVLEEAEFFASQGLYEDAEAILADTLAAAPGHILLTERLAEVRESRERLGIRERTSERPAEDQAFDIAASLEALDDLGTALPKAKAPTEEVDVDQVFAKFKEGIKATIDDSDASTHYDLGVAYKEMGLVDDAIGEFELASRDLERSAMCSYMIGCIERDRGRLDQAREAFLVALRSKMKSDAEQKAVEYDLALVYEQQNDRQSAIVMLKTIYRRDQAYRDVEKRIHALGSVPSQNPKDEDAELDAALDNLFG